MAGWADVERVAGSLPGAEPGLSHSGLPSYDVHGVHFARWREDAGREILQFWCRDPADVAHYRGQPGTFFRIDTFPHHASVWAWLDALSVEALAEALTESWASRASRRLVEEHFGDG